MIISCWEVKNCSTIPVSFEEVKNGLAKDLEGEAHVTKVVEAVKHPHAQVFPLGVLKKKEFRTKGV